MTHTLSGRIMRRVYGVWFLKRALPYIALEIAVLVGALKLFASSVFVSEAVHNALTFAVGSPVRLLAYVASSFAATGLAEQLMVLALGLGALFMFRDVVRSIVSYAVLKRVHVRN